jgi:hypothetical protein
MLGSAWVSKCQHQILISPELTIKINIMLVSASDFLIHCAVDHGGVLYLTVADDITIIWQVNPS